MPYTVLMLHQLSPCRVLGHLGVLDLRSKAARPAGSEFLWCRRFLGSRSNLELALYGWRPW